MPTYSPQDILVMAADLERMQRRRDEMRERGAPIPDWFAVILARRECELEDATQGHETVENNSGTPVALPRWFLSTIAGAFLVMVLATVWAVAR